MASLAVPGSEEERARRVAYLASQPDFQALAQKYTGFSRFVQGGRLDFRDWHAVHALTRTLLCDGFGVHDWNIPEGYLVPALPNRMNYLLWIDDLLHLSRGMPWPP